MTAREMMKIAYDALSEKKGKDIYGIDIEGLTIVTDAFLLVTGENSRQVAALQDAVQEALGKVGVHPKSIEGQRSASWILMDYGDLIIHVFDRESRSFYDLERIWRDGKRIDLSTL